MIKIAKDLSEAGHITHAGNFHADDVFSSVFLDKLNDGITLIRLKDYTDDGSKLTFDIGGGKFDHHGYDTLKRDDGITYCSFGLLWREYGKSYLKKINVQNIDDTFNIFDYLLVESIDAFDNGELDINTDYNVYTISSLIELLRPKTSEDEDECFLKATRVASCIFDLVISATLDKVKAIDEVKKYIPTIKDKILVLDEYVPYEFALFYLNLDVDFVVYPSNRGGWCAKAVPIKYKSFTNKTPFKKEWAGLRDEELQKASGVKTARFCHNKLFLVTVDTKEDALKLVYLTINDN